MAIYKKASWLMSGVGLALISSVAAHAQGNGPATGAAEVEGLDDIVVTAQKRSENIQKVPIAMSALSAEAMERRNIRAVNDITSQVPNLQVAAPYSDAVPVFSLRGISAVDYSQNQSSPVAIYVDEVYKGLPVFTSLQVFDLDRVEVLRGPQGTLYGKNTTGGAVNFYTRKPDVNKGFTGYLGAGYGRLDRRELNGGMNVPLIDGVMAGRLAFTYTKVDGFVKNLFPGQKDQGAIDDLAVRASLAIVPSDSLNILVRYTRSSSTPDGYGQIANDIGIAGPGGAGFGTGYTRAGVGFFENESDRTGRLDIQNQSASLTVNWDFAANAALTSVTSFDDGRWLTEEDGDGTPFNLLHDDYLSDARSFSQDLRLASTGDGPFKWLVGAYFYRDRVRNDVIFRYFYDLAGDNDGNGQLDCFDDGLTGCAYSNSFKQKRKSFAFYTQNNYTLDNGLTFTLGLRYTKDNNRLPYYRAFLSYFDPATGQQVDNVAQTIVAPPVSRLKNDNISGKIGISYDLGGSLLYAHASRGYRGGSFNGVAFIDPSEVTIAQPERLDAFEAGAKIKALDNRLRLNLAGFYYNYKNQQFIDITPTFQQVLYNAPKSRLWGGEVELTAQPVRPLTIRVGASYLNAKYRRIVLRGIDLAGNHMIVAPKWTLSGGVDWTLLDLDGGSLTLHTDSRFTSRQYFDAFNDPALVEPGYSVHDARLTFETEDQSIALSGWMKNIFDKKYQNSRLGLADTFNFNLGQRGRPREYGVQLTYRF